MNFMLALAPVAELRPLGRQLTSTLMQQRNNLIVGFAVVAALFLAVMPMDWYTGIFAVSGKNGSIGFPGTPKLPIWFLLSASMAAVVVLGLNVAKVTAVPRWLLILVLLLCGAYYLLPIVVPEEGHFPDGDRSFFLRPEAGPFVALGATLAAILLAAMGMRQRPNQALQRTAG